MPPPGQAQRSAQKFIVFEQFEKMNTQSVRQALSEKELAWLENLQPISGNNLTTVPAPLSALTSISETITAQFFANLGAVDYIISFTSVGGGWATNIATAVSTEFAQPGTFSNPDMTVWHAVNVITGGTQYGPAPGVVFAGGGGSGAAATASIDPRGLNTITITFQGQYNLPTVPSVGFSGGGGSGAAATIIMTLSGGGFYVVQSITITNRGSGYSSAPIIAITGGAPVPGGDARAICTVGDGRVTAITVTNGGSGYTSAPSVSFTGGGSGTGASAAAVVGGSNVTTLTLTNPGSGYLSSDALTLTISGGGGSGATGTAHVWPFVTAGTTLAVFQGRVWLGGGRLIQYTGTGGFDDFAAANASASFTINDADLVHAVTALRNYNNYLFIMGDQSVKQIGNISLNAAGNVTLFTILTLSSDQGTIYPRSCGSFNRVFMFANSNGIYAVFGSSVQKISDDLDGIFKLIDFSQQPQSAIADINGIHNISFLVRYIDPLSTTRSIMMTFTGKKWFVVSQGDSLVTIATASTLASGKTSTFSSSGSDITKILGDPTTAVTFKFQSALTHHGNAVQRKKILSGGAAETLFSGTGNLTATYDTENGSATKVYALTSGFKLPSGAAGAEGSGRYLGITLTGTLAGFTITNAAVEYQETSLWT